MTKHQLVEFAWGLANSKKTFLWVIKVDMVEGESAVLLQDFITETKERGFLASWFCQEEVITHPAIGGYLMLCGWNSTMESLCGGVPMICWPFFSEQQTNCWFSSTKLDVGMELESNANRFEIERILRELMDGEKGKQMKKKAMEWKLLPDKATTAPNGSSYKNFEQVINNALSKSRNNYED
ncbi:hypothetical protein Patl1_07548 [Pistacia atlantica]|uniref:Uncharacterized protein n=1 Tax=Pistacia atlantica TaxID=434234 RepID=A0ACC1AJJ4_9ROSI|nr:hypothetical protein Patl1_07548 [Pistacia atlantica]